MTNVFTTYNEQLFSCRVVASTNQTGTYFNGSSNSGLGATFTYTSSGSITVDGVVLALNDSVVLVGQTSTLQNGIYLVTGDGISSSNVILTRRPDFQTASQMKTGASTTISAGTSFGGSEYVLTEPVISLVGSDAITFKKVDGIISSTASNAGGSATVTITDSNIASTSLVFVAIRTSANAVTIQKVTPGTGSVVVLLSGDPGASTYSYMIIKK